MRHIAFGITLASFLFSTTFAVEKPIAGKPFTLVFDVGSSRVLSGAKDIWVVYVFDYWGTKAVQKLKGEGPQEDLFQNVLEPDRGRSTRVKMLRYGNIWKADIPIPLGARLLSYYFTDANRRDDNNRQTFVTFICDQSENPVRGARLANVDFLIMSGKGLSDILENLREEMKHYPDNLTAHMVYWRFRFFDSTSPDTLRILVAEAKQHYAQLRKQLGDTVLNYQAHSLVDIIRIANLSFKSRITDPRVSEFMKQINTDIVNTVEEIPTRMRVPAMAQYELWSKQMLQAPTELTDRNRQRTQEHDESIRELVGQTAPDFSFVTTDGAKRRLSDFRGNLVLLDFWGSWCGPCLGDIPNLVQVFAEFRSRGLVMLSVSNDASASKWSRQNLADFAAKKGMKWMQVLDDTSASIHQLFKIRFWPNLFLIDRNGKVLQRQELRGEDLKRTLSTILPK